MSVMILVGDCRERLRGMEAASVHTCVTSPPYFGLRDYGTESWSGGDPDHEHDRIAARGGRGGSGAPGKNPRDAFPSTLPADVCSCGAVRVDNQIGLEPTPDEFVAALVEVFREVRRVLRDDGTVWLNLGDSYSGSGKGVWNAPDEVKKAAGIKETYRPSSDPVAKVDTGLKAKDLIGIPWRVAFALQADGWYLRQDIIWHKPNPMPESVTDRCTKAHEYIFLLSKGPRYFFDAAAIAEPSIYAPDKTTQVERPKGFYEGKRNDGGDMVEQSFKAIRDTRNKRSVWTVASRPFADAHFATYPPDLIEPCILAGAPERACLSCGAPHVPKYEATDVEDASAKGSTFDKGKTGARDGGDRTQEGPRFVKRLAGVEPSCGCGAEYGPATVLDPFGGAGTTGLVADRLGRNAVLCELNPAYAAMAEKRLRADGGMFIDVTVDATVSEAHTTDRG